MLKTSNLLGYYRFEGNVNDSSGNSANGTLSGATVVTAKQGRGYSFDGSNDYISLPITVTQPITICLWYKTHSTVVNERSVINNTPQTAPSTNWSNAIRINSDGEFEAYIYDSGATAIVKAVSGVAAAASTWYHLCLTLVNGGDLEIYVNGVLKANTAVITGEALGDKYILCYRGSALAGIVDEVSFYNTKLKNDDIKRVMLGLHPLNLSFYTVTALMVAGGGGGGAGWEGGGAGAGGYTEKSVSVASGTAYTITIGAGGASEVSGNNSVFSGNTMIAGGRGGDEGARAAVGGSGGGLSRTTPGAAGTAGQGYAGGGNPVGGQHGSGGGGGASEVGHEATGDTAGGDGGDGVETSINGTATYYAGGGGGSSNGTAGSGGLGGGGAGGATSVNGTAGAVNTGGGGGGARTDGNNGGAGGSGVVIIAYEGSQKGTGGTVTSSGGNTIHTFTSSGTYTG